MNDIGTKSIHCQIMCVEPEITVMSNAVLLSLGFHQCGIAWSSLSKVKLNLPKVLSCSYSTFVFGSGLMGLHSIAFNRPSTNPTNFAKAFFLRLVSVSEIKFCIATHLSQKS